MTADSTRYPPRMHPHHVLSKSARLPKPLNILVDMQDYMQYYSFNVHAQQYWPQSSTPMGGYDVKKRWGLRSKLWLEYEGTPVIGDGRMKMLRSIHSGGSIKRAAIETGISYRRMRGALHEMENTIGYPLVKIQRGGGAGGGAELTPAAHALMDTFKKLSAGFQQDADARFDALRDFFVPANGNIRHSVVSGDDTP